MRHIPRIIPVLLLRNTGLVKTLKFKDPKYVGDPLNAVKIFNDKEVDELIFLDITATNENRKPNTEIIKNIASECFMPVCYGGGIKTIEDIASIIRLGIEKVSINSRAFNNPNFIKQAADMFGSSTIVVSIDVKKNFWGNYEVVTHNNKLNTKIAPEVYAEQMQKLGAGEILLNSIDRDGTMQGYDLDLIKKVCSCVDIPVIVCGGAGTLSDFKLAIENGASACAAGSMFVFHGKHRAVLISYPLQEEIKKLFCY